MNWHNRCAARRLIATLVVLVLLPTTVRAAEVDLPTYLQRLTQARDALTQAKTQFGPPREASVQRARDALAGIDGVTVDGARYPPQHQGTLTTLGRTPPDVERALAEVETVRAALVAEQGTRPDPQARAKLETVLRDRAFREAEPNFAQVQALRFRSWLGEQFDKLFRPLNRINPPEPPQDAPGIAPVSRFLAFLGNPWTLLALAAIVAVVLLLLWLRRRERRARRAKQEPEFRERTAAQWRDHAATLAARGDYRAAVRALYLGTITALDERGLVPFDPALTDREYLRAAQAQHGWLLEPLRPFVRLVEQIIYANAPCGVSEYARARELADGVMARVGSPQAVAA